MKRIRYHDVRTVTFALAISGVFTGVALATPVPNGAILYPRTFNDCPSTTLSSNNMYPALISFDESNLNCAGGQNMHVWNFSADGGASPIILSNPDGFEMGATLELVKGSSVAMEGGLLVSAFYSVNTNGYFQARLPDGEIAVFGGELRFYSFSDPAGHNLRYTGGRITLSILYQPSCNTQAHPGEYTYKVVYNGITYLSPTLPVDGCNMMEEAMHGCWGIRDNVHVGGRIANLMFNGGPGAPADHNVGNFFDIFFAPVESNCATPTARSTWGELKAIYR